MLHLIQRIAVRLAARAWRLRSGATDGADAAFEAGAGGEAEIYLPWRGFNNGHASILHTPTPEAFDLAARHHPTWRSLSPAAKKLMARNAHQVLGHDLAHPAQMVVRWTSDGCEPQATRTRATGGTGLAIALADSVGIPVFNLCNAGALERIGGMVEATIT